MKDEINNNPQHHQAVKEAIIVRRNVCLYVVHKLNAISIN